jgi:hypothetical protein
VKASICSADICTAWFITNHVTSFEQGGVVNEP